MEFRTSTAQTVPRSGCRHPGLPARRIRRRRKEISVPSLVTAHAITACYAISNRLSLTGEELALLDERGQALTPAFWSETKAMLELADRADGPTSIELAFDHVLHAWLGVSGEDALVQRFGMTIAEGMALDAGDLSALAASLEQRSGAGQVPLELCLSHAWTARAERLMDGLPGTGELVLRTLERAVDGLAWDAAVLRAPVEAILQVACLVGDEVRAKSARRLLAMLDGSSAEPGPSGSVPLAVAAQILTVLFALTHDGLLLAEERAFEPGIGPSSYDFRSIATALREGRLQPDNVPAPTRLLPVWGAPDDLTGDAVRECLRSCAAALPELLDEVARLWGGGPQVDVSGDVSRAMASIAVIRHMQVERAHLPLPGERDSVWWEVHQGARRPASLERAGLLRRLRTVLTRCEVDPLAVAAAHLDRANELQALGDHDRTREALAEVMRWTARYEGEQARRDHGAVAVAQQRWLEGDPEDALRRLRNLDGEKARELVEAIAARAGAREVLREAEEEHRRERTVESWCEVAISHLLAGHTVRAEFVARQICDSHPESGLASHILASVLTELGRYRDAVAPARRALECAEDLTPDRASLARILARIGDDGREESVALALDVLKAHDVLTAIPRGLLAELLDLAHYGGANPALTRRIDGCIRAYRAKCDPPPGWLGAAVARQLHGVPSLAALDWLSELAEAGPQAPAELARLVVERVETLQWWRTLIERDVEAKAGEVPGSFSPEWIPEAARQLARRDARTEAVGAALRAAVALGYAEPEVHEGYAGSGTAIESARHWAPHLRPIAAFFGDELAIRLCASESAQRTWFSQDELPEDELLVLLATFDNERVAWLRWAGQCEAIADLAAMPGLTPSTGLGLQHLLEVARLDDDETLREQGWPTRWQEVSSP